MNFDLEAYSKISLTLISALTVFVVFLTHSAWVGKLSQIEKSSTKHSLPVVGDRVRVKAHVEEPTQGLGSVKHGRLVTYTCSCFVVQDR